MPECQKKFCVSSQFLLLQIRPHEEVVYSRSSVPLINDSPASEQHLTSKLRNPKFLNVESSSRSSEERVGNNKVSHNCYVNYVVSSSISSHNFFYSQVALEAQSAIE